MACTDDYIKKFFQAWPGCIPPFLSSNTDDHCDGVYPNDCYKEKLIDGGCLEGSDRPDSLWYKLFDETNGNNMGSQITNTNAEIKKLLNNEHLKARKGEFQHQVEKIKKITNF